MATASENVKAADLLSTGGAFVLGIGAGVLLERWLAPAGVVLALLGAALHARGMAMKHRIEVRDKVARWWQWLYTLCWAGLVVLGLLAVLNFLRQART